MGFRCPTGSYTLEAEIMFVFQQHFSPTAAPVEQNSLHNFEASLNTKPVQELLSRYQIDSTKGTPQETAKAVADLMRKDQTFTNEWQRLTGLDLRQMEAIVSEFERRQAFDTAKLAAEVRQAGRNVTSAIQKDQDNQEYADKLGEKLNRLVRPKKVNPAEFQPKNAA
jgi:hypothetical protein